MKQKFKFDPENGVIVTDNFSRFYAQLNDYILNRQTWQPSRDGEVKELLNFKTTLTNPYQRLQGVARRNMNVFFSLAEAMWIFTGRKDVNFLLPFNSHMINFSDDGKTQHAPYGWRIRHWGVRTEDKFVEENMHAAQGYDQLEDAIRILQENPNSRQVVISIWNPEFDLGCKTRDIPCNDMLMFKIRNGELITTVQNRSNDLHWGLPTNIFQFSFLTELMATCLGITLGTQTHNSQSLHIYKWNKTAEEMDEYYKSWSDTVNDNRPLPTLYDGIGSVKPFRFNFAHEVAVNRLRELDTVLFRLMDNVWAACNGKPESVDEVEQIKDFSTELYKIYQLLKTYVLYKHDIADNTQDADKARLKALERIELIAEGGYENWDVIQMARNFFVRRLKDKSGYKVNGSYIGEL